MAYDYNGNYHSNNNRGGGAGLGTIVIGVFLALVAFAVIG